MAMHVIATHANADFDSVASLLGAWYLYPDALPVLPPTINRNVRDFITLYENMLPFVHQHDLGRRTITRLTLVDTMQIPYNLHHLAPELALHIIDHHADIHHPPPAGAIVSLADTGACATLLVEQIRELPKRLSSLEATLLLLGIYEDTGALTYGSTTPRDLQAAAWLLSEGRARLGMVREYLNYPMSRDQTALYEQLIERLETHHIHGHTVIISPGQVDHYVEEISSLAGRLRDLYQPEGLFILVEMPDHVQIVARSITDAINVGLVAEQFGGGGHSRTSAALVKNRSLAEVRQRLLDVLEREVQPATRVGQIMSRGARTLSPDDTVRHAAAMMERYGHEGFPVIDRHTGRIAGIMSRREIDKARRHRLDGAPIRQFMKKGEFYVTPQDSIDAVQQLMTSQQIGQVPVVDHPGGGVIGIVTRTDLINLWHATTEEPAPYLNLAGQLAQAISPELLQMLQQAGRQAARQDDTLYIVGGFVRDLLITLLFSDQPNSGSSKTSPRFDLDLVVEGDAIALAQQLQQQHGGRVRSHSRFGTAKWILDQPLRFNPPTAPVSVPLSSLDFVTARTEFYRHPSALPEVEQSSIRQDLHRRDFTINTLALDLTPDYFGRLLDFYGGEADLEARLIRVPHSLSFVEDPTRMLRAARLLARLEFALEERTAELLNDALDLLEKVSGERITHELELIFRERRPEKALQQLEYLGILAAIHPGLVVDDLFISQVQTLRGGLAGTPWQGVRPEAVHYLGLMSFSLARDEVEALVERLNLRSYQRETLQQVYQIKRNAPQIARAEKASQLYHLLARTNNDAQLIAWLALDNPAARRQLVRYQSQLKAVTPLIDGHYLKKELRLSPGPIFKEIMDALRDARLDGRVETIEDERAIAAQIAAERGR
ncbi:MAG: CBS domain-containing protein [Anaerolineae bacterium]